MTVMAMSYVRMVEGFYTDCTVIRPDGREESITSFVEAADEESARQLAAERVFESLGLEPVLVRVRPLR